MKTAVTALLIASAAAAAFAVCGGPGRPCPAEPVSEFMKASAPPEACGAAAKPCAAKPAPKPAQAPELKQGPAAQAAAPSAAAPEPAPPEPRELTSPAWMVFIAAFIFFLYAYIARRAKRRGK